MKADNELLKEIATARENTTATDRFIEKYTPFIRSEVMKLTGDSDPAGKDDEVSVAMFAFYEALMNYDRKKGAFFPLARVYIRNRLIDYQRQDPAYGRPASLDEEVFDDEKTTLLDTIEDEKSSVEYQQNRECTAEEIAEFTADLATYGLSLSDIADNAPRQQRTMEQCMAALDYARAHEDILEKMIGTKKLPLSRLVKDGGFDRKTLERHRKYLIGIFLAFTNGFVIIRGHLTMMKEVRND